MEDLDLAQERSELERAYIVDAIRRRQPAKILPDGACRWCGELIAYPRLFCGSECAEQWEVRRR